MSENYNSCQKLNIEKMLSILKFNYQKFSIYKKVILILKALFTSIITKYYSDDIDDVNYDFLFFKTQDRSDYNLLYESIYSQCEYSKLDLTLKRSTGLNIFFIYKSIAKIKILRDLKRKHGLLDGLFLYIMFIRYIQSLNIIKVINYKYIVVFSEVQPLENLFVQYAKLNNKTTVTLQHGLYIDYTNSPNINMFNYLDVQSEYLLSWGKMTKELFEKYNHNIKTFICGKPIEIKQITSEINKNLFGVLLDQPMFKQYNKEMLEIAFEFARKNDMKIIIKTHPADNINNYEIDLSLIDTDNIIEKTSFVVAHTTSLIQEYILQGKKVLKYRSDIPSHEYSEPMVFSNINELGDKYNSNFDFTQEALQYITFSGNEAKKRYAIFFDCLYNNKLFNLYKDDNVKEVM